MNIQAPIADGKRAGPFTGPAAAALVLLLFWAAMVASLRDKSLTFDEGAYAVAGCSAWRLGDYRLNPEAGALPQRLAGLPLALGAWRLPPPGSDHWRRAQAQHLGYDFFYGCGNDAAAMAARGRAACGLFAVALGFLVWTWSRRLFGPAGAMVSLLLYVLNPTVLANGALMTSDMAAALFLAAATWAWWRLLERLTPARMLGAGLLAGCLFVSKMSAVLFVPVMLALAVFRVADRRPLPVSRDGRGVGVGSRAGRTVAIALAGGGVAVIAGLVIWAFYGFRYSAFAGAAGEGHFQFTWEAVLSGGFPVAAPPFSLETVDFLRRHQVLPESWLYGLGIILNRTQSGAAFWNGAYSTSGWPGFLPYTFLVKTPLAALAVLMVAAWAAGRRIWRRETVPLGIFLAVYGIAAVAGHRDIGHRYLLPVYAPLFVLAGAAGIPAARRGARTVLAALLAALAVEAVAWYPDYLAYFNGIVRPSEAYRHLVDSSLDWGQDLPAVRDYMRSNPGAAPYYFSYFGAGSPGYYGIDARPLYSFDARYLEGDGDVLLPALPGAGVPAAMARLGRDHPGYEVMGVARERDDIAVLLRKTELLKLSAGTYLVSATMLQSVCDWQVHGAWNPAYEAAWRELKRAAEPFLSADPGVRADVLGSRGPEASRLLLYQFGQYRMARLAAWLRGRRPDATIRYSILVYRLSDADIRAALEGPLPASD